MYERAIKLAQSSSDYTITCDWVTGNHDETPAAECAMIDLNQIKNCDVFIFCNDVGTKSPGKHVELGYALGILTIPQVYIVGPKKDRHEESVFYSHPQVTRRFETWEECFEYLTQE
jgi:hypothetical protein